MTDNTFNLKLFKRRVAYVLNYFDEEREIPWNYVCRTGDGRFEAIVTYLFDDLTQEQGGEARERLLGIFDNCEAAVACVRDHLARINAADHFNPFDPLTFERKRTIQ